MSNTGVRTVLTRAFAAAFVLAASFAGAGDSPHSRYPNELHGFKFYSKYLAPLQPGLSSRDSVRRVLGDTAAVNRNGWTIIPTYTTLGSVYQIIVRPGGVIPMAAVKFSSAFTHCHSIESEINITFDVYGDRFGLEYWLHEQDSEWGKKGDLYRIVYAERRRPEPPNTFCG